MPNNYKIKYFHYRSCLCKIKHNTLQEALVILLKQQSKGLTVDNIYKCIFCNKYHIGHWKHRERIKRLITQIIKKRV